MKYSDEFIEETLKENINLRLEFFKLKEKAQKYYDKYNNYRHQISKEAQNKNKEQIVRERDILKDRIDKAIKCIEKLDENKLEIGDNLLILDNYLSDLLDILEGKVISDTFKALRGEDND